MTNYLQIDLSTWYSSNVRSRWATPWGCRIYTYVFTMGCIGSGLWALYLSVTYTCPYVLMRCVDSSMHYMIASSAH